MRIQGTFVIVEHLGGEGGGPPILSRLFLPLSRCFQAERATRRRRHGAATLLPLARSRYILNAAKWMRRETPRRRRPRDVGERENEQCRISVHFVEFSVYSGSVHRNMEAAADTR